MPGRSYISYMNRGSKEQGLTYSGLVMISLLLSKTPMKCCEVTSDITGGSESDNKKIYTSIHLTLQKLEEDEYIKRDEYKAYSATREGRRVFKKMLDRESKMNNWRKFTDRTTP